MKKCPYCNIDVYKPQNHIYTCKNKPNEHSKADVRYEYLIYNYPYIASKNGLLNEYEMECKSLPDLKKEFGIDYAAVCFLLDKYKIHKRSIAESSKKISRDKYVNTCRRKYGASNALSKGTTPYKKRNRTVKHKYGVNNVFQLERVKEKITQTCLEKYGSKRITNPLKISQTKNEWSQNKRDAVSKKISQAHHLRNKVEKKKSTNLYKETCKRRYGVDFYSQLEEVKKNNKEKHIEMWNNKTKEEKNKILYRLHNITCSNIESRINTILFSWDIEYVHSFYLRHKQFDFKIGRVLIEVNGDFYHANPEKYEPYDIIMIPKTKGVLASKIWLKDASKREMAEKLGFSVVYIWEKEINSLDDDDLEILLWERIFDENKID